MSPRKPAAPQPAASQPVEPALDEYAAKRDFAKTPEPSGHAPAPGRSRRTKRPRFVVQEHHARALHWDLRLEHDGTLASWAVPKGVPQDPKTNHLAVRTEDHPMQYLAFHGDIPAGEYGAGTMKIWDRGEYELHEWEAGKVQVTLHGERVDGRYALFRTGGKNWMIHRMDPPQDPGRAEPPAGLRPMLATLAHAIPRGDGWAFEMKWDGVRALADVRGGRVQLTSRNGNDVTPAYPELRGLGEQLGTTEVVLDGEVVALDEQGRASFQRLQPRMHVRDRNAARRLANRVPVVYMIFDVLWLDGHSTMPLPYTERRRVLEGLGLHGAAWQTPPAGVANGAAAVRASKELGFEGVVAKRLDSVYEPAKRSNAWRKVKNTLRQELVVGGWLAGEGGRAGRIGALLVGYTDDAGRLVYAGKVGTGFTDAELERLAPLLEQRARDTSPFAGRGVPKDAHFVEPELVAEVRFTEWTDAGRIRHPAYLGLRDDKDARDVVRET